MYFAKDVAKAIEAAITRFHCYLFEDNEWGYVEYFDMYGPLALFIAFEVSILVIAGIVN